MVLPSLILRILGLRGFFVMMLSGGWLRVALLYEVSDLLLGELRLLEVLVEVLQRLLQVIDLLIIW